MQKPIKHISAVLGRIIFIGLSLQIVLGILWIGYNFGDFQEFGDSLFYLEVSKSLLFDEYTGALYPVLLVLVRGIEEILRIPYTYVVHFLQLIVAGYAGYYFLRTCGMKGRFFPIWGSLSILTFPMIAQCHMAILPNSLSFSVFLLEMAFVLQPVIGKTALRPVQLCKANVFWLLGALLMPDYFYFGMVPVLLLLLYDLCKFRAQLGKRFLCNLILTAAFVGIITSVEALVQEEGCYGKPGKTMEAALFRRVAWTSLYEYYGSWPQELREVCPDYFVRETSFFADNMERMLQPLLEEALGEARARELYVEVADMIFANRKSKILHETAWDAVGYALPPVAAGMLLTGRGYDSYVGRNYEIMRREAPVFTKYYMDYSCWWFVAGIILAFVIELGLWLQGKRKSIFPAVICIIVSGVFVLWYTLYGAGMWDYKNALFIGAMWISLMILPAAKSLNEEKENGQ